MLMVIDEILNPSSVKARRAKIVESFKAMHLLGFGCRFQQTLAHGTRTGTLGLCNGRN